MPINATIITTDCIVTLAEPVDCLLDAMIDAQNRLGQITWTNIQIHRAHGTYQGHIGTPAPVVVVDTSATTELLTSVNTWIKRH